ncbi:MAG: hypothetical protein MG2_0809 [uncultured Candidatus Poseidoniales archaeon]|nr:MAG: hypothetical protein MG2_0809 [uncultured Candidatus Poseidoniales archaeon]
MRLSSSSPVFCRWPTLQEDIPPNEEFSAIGGNIARSEVQVASPCTSHHGEEEAEDYAP